MKKHPIFILLQTAD